MSNRTISILLISFLLTLAQLGRASITNSQQQAILRIHLPREVAIKDETIKLGRVSIVHGKESLIDKANDIILGKFTVPAQQISISRPMILSRLACNGIKASDIALTGAEKVKITRQQRIIKADKLVDVAGSFLKNNLPADSVCCPNPIKMPEDLILPAGSNDIKFTSHLVGGNSAGRATVRITVISEGEPVAFREIPFHLKYRCNQLVALSDIASGETISSENVKIEKQISSRPEHSNRAEPYGLVARRKIAADTIIRSGMIRAAKPEVVVKRNSNVAVVVEKPGLSVTAIGKAMENGCVGDYIKVKVKITSSSRIIFAKVNENGTVQPVF